LSAASAKLAQSCAPGSRAGPDLNNADRGLLAQLMGRGKLQEDSLSSSPRTRDYGRSGSRKT